MNVVLICPGEEAMAPFLGPERPLVAVRLLGQSLLEYWLSHLARSGAQQVVVVAHDRPDEVGKVVSDGSRWGLTVSVFSETGPLTPPDALLKYAGYLNSAPASSGVILPNHFPGFADHPLFTGPAEFMAALQVWMPQALTPDRVGMREVRPGIWAGVNSAISPGAKLAAPCWVGQHVLVGPDAIIGPGTVIEDGVVIEPFAEIEDSWIGTRTLVGQFTRLQSALAWGNRVVNWKTGTASVVPDPFVLCALNRIPRGASRGLLTRITELYRRNKERAPLLVEGARTA